MDYEFWNFFVNCCVAVGTIAAVVVALYLARPKKERADGYFEIIFDDNPKLQTVFLENSVINTVSKKTVLNFWVNNTGDTNILFNYKAGLFLKVNNDCEKITLNSANENDLFIPRKMKKHKFSFDLNLINNRVSELYNKNCTLSVYTIEGTEIELKKK
jgi:hypothetical protein